MRATLVAGLLLCAQAVRAEPPLASIAVDGPAEAVDELQRDEPAASGAQLDEIVVTARRREERAIDVPVSMIVVGGDALAEAGAFRPQDIQQRTPGLTVSVPSPRLAQYTIRGLGSSSQNDGMESSVGLFLDGVYLGRQGLSMFDLVDLERIEVLRGPQGTLFGKNTTAGALNIVTRKPTDTFEALAETSLGDTGWHQARGSVSGPLLSDLSGRLSGYATQKDGSYDNRYGGERLNDQHRAGARGQLLWTPTPALSARLIAEYGSQDERCCVYPLIVYRDEVRARDEYMEYERVTRDPYARITDSDTVTRSRVHQRALSAELNWDLDDEQRVVSISAYRHWQAVPTSDDATSLDLVPETGVANDHQQFSQELRLHSRFESFDSTLGLYYLYQHLRGDERNVFGRDLVGWSFGGLIRELVPFATESNTGPLLYAIMPPETLDGMRLDTDTFQISHSAASFISVDWHLSDRLDLTTGFRYTYEWKQGGVTRERSGGCADCTALSVVNPVSTLLGTLLGQDLSALSTDGLLDAIVGGDYDRRTKRHEGNWSGQLALRYELTPQLNTYASITRGYKGGGINLGATGDAVKPTFKPEKATAYETGLKSAWFDQRLSSSLALYQTDVIDYQALTFDDTETVLGSARQLNLLNVGRVRLRGVEADATALPWPQLRLRAAGAYNRAVSLDFPNAPNEDSRANDKDLSGKTLYNAPRWILSAGLEPRASLARSLQLYAGVDYYYRSGAWATVEQGAGSYIDAYDLLNARIGLRRNDESDSPRWDVSLWMRNLLDEHYLSSVYALYGVGEYGGTAGDERSYGVTLRLGFGE